MFMINQQPTTYRKITQVIEYLQHNSTKQYNLDEIAQNLDLSLTDLQWLFNDWAEVEFEKFLKSIGLEYVKKILNNSPSENDENKDTLELLGMVRLPNLPLIIEEMTPDEYENKGERLTINYNIAETIFGDILVASTQKGICYMAFFDDQQVPFLSLKKRFPNATFVQQTDDIQQNALKFDLQHGSIIDPIKLHLKGTDFQINVWKALLKIPMGSLATYGNIAEIIQNPNAARAVGTAIGCNPIAYLIPCHRVVQSSGLFGGYRWGTTRKVVINGWEACKVTPSVTKK